MRCSAHHKHTAKSLSLFEKREACACRVHHLHHGDRGTVSWPHTSSGMTGLGTSLSGEIALGSGAKTCTPKSAKTCFLGLTKEWRGRAGVRFSLRCLTLLPAGGAVLPSPVEPLTWLRGVLEVPLLPADDLQQRSKQAFVLVRW